MDKKVIVIGEVHIDLYYENTFYADLVKYIIENLISFIRFNPDDLLNRDLLKKVIYRGFANTPKKIDGLSFIKRGGNGNNTSEYLSLLNVPVKLISIIGKNSEWMIEELSKLNIDVEDIFQIDELTPISTIIKSEFTTKIHLAPNLKERMNFQNININRINFKNPNIVFITPVAQKFKIFIDKVDFRYTIVAVNVEYQKIKNEPQLKQVLSNSIDIVFVNLSDAKLIFDVDRNLGEIDSKLRKYAKIRVYTDGKNGSYICIDNNEVINIPIVDVPVIDRTGAGDCFAAGFLAKFYHLVENKENLINLFKNKTKLLDILESCAKNGTYIAAYKISYSSLPKKMNIKEFISNIKSNK